MKKANQVYVIAGPTASGKTALAIKWAQELGTEIINFDSRQIYHELRIGVARPLQEELSSVTHHLMASHSILNPLNAASFSTLAREIALDCIERNGSVVLVGGTGLYLNAFLEGLDEFPPLKPELRVEIQAIFDQEGIEGLTKSLLALDPAALEWVQKDNPARLMRALEITKASGLPVSEWRKNKGEKFPFEAKIIAIERDRKQLYDRIDKRVDLMLNEGLEAEVRGLIDYQELPVMKTVGYQEFFDYFAENNTYEQTISLIKQKTRNYAKRQTTWFKNKTNTEWISPEKLKKYSL